MNDGLEKSLQQALKPVDPEEGFEERVLARVRAEQASPARWLQSRFRAFGAALAASAVLAVVVTHAWQQRQERRGLEARQQLIEALKVTGEKLDIAYQSVNSESRHRAANDAGA
jgi:hypothetical protein